jgi:hypothetical protein
MSRVRVGMQLVFFRCTSHQECRIVSEKLRLLAMTCCARKAN